MEKIRCAVESGDVLGESPVWDDRRGVLWWVDIHGRRLHGFEPESGAHHIAGLAEQVACVALTEGSGLVAGTRTGFARLDPETGRTDPIIEPLDGASDLRFNDGRVDRRGRFWSGSVQEKRVPGGAALYRLDADERCTLMLDGVTVSNGLSWSPDDTRMYFADSHAREIYAFDFDAASGALSGRRIFARFGGGQGMPDGATVDADGHLWTAAIGGWQILRFAPDGQLVRSIRLPVSQPTSCSFGGSGLATLYVTTATQRLSEEERRAQPLAGHLFALDVGAHGLPEPRWGGRP